MKDIYPKVVESFEKNSLSVLATIVKQAGSAPREIGTKFLILEDGTAVGTIGGGLLEARILEEAQTVFAHYSPRLISISLTGDAVAETHMLCGGDVTVFLEPVSPNNFNNIHLFKEVVEVNRRGGSGVLATLIDPERWFMDEVPKLFINAAGDKKGSILGNESIDQMVENEMTRIIKDKQPRIIIGKDSDGDDLEIFVEPLISNPILYVFGAGHVSSQIVPLATLADFKVIVVDDRPEFADATKFPEAEEVHHCPFEGAVKRFKVDTSSYIVIVTRGHTHDKTVLVQSLRTDAGYIGMIGSRRKRNIVYQSLLEEGFAQADLDRVHSPIGLDIGAETPEEIAVSIVAELIKVRAGLGD
ncbi:XdhC family aldehyde oxidoreductase maturation factor [Thermodesulfobacteriota bacterium]